MRIAAKHAGEFNLSSASPEVALDKFGQLDDACKAAGRQPATLTRSAMVGTLIGRNHAQVERRIEALVKLLAGDADDGPGAAGSDEWLAERREPLDHRHAGSMPARGSASTRTPAASGSCSRTSSPGIST